ncbi:MAG: mannose-1-phosphate guanylyltransferase [Clostridium sp.]|nr:mannose-1-phosphate guanylyltransferase [Prevotella sp.]MCM1429011.1 mannose-1-phosphate guanylyltransferase [Clostridium sp.]MCM1475459.1 mannose-1-phosphate guanylyltransferase [Muribaculaceae bacterium]
MRYCVIMCGGVGSRFWPFSRTNMPKQFLDFFGTGRSLLQMTLDRILPVVPAERIVIVTNRQYRDIIREQLPQISESNILLEPARRNTSPCVCWAAHHIYALDPEASIVTLPSDHLILKEEAFHKALIQGFEFVESTPSLLSLGIQPTYPNTGYGYIQKGKPVEGFPGIMKVKTFTEKPDLEMAKVFLSSGEFFWNAGIFLWSAKSILDAYSQLAPETAAVFDKDISVFGSARENEFVDEIYATAPSISVDYDIMERADNVYVETADLGWSDLGTWKALYETSPHNEDGNVTQNCRLIAHDCHNTMFAVGGKKLIVAAGLDDYIVADNGNALLIYPIAEEQKIRTIVNEVKTRFGEEFV